MSAGTSCPECSGLRLDGHPAGVLVISHAPTCTLGAAEDSRRAADAERVAARPFGRGWSRPTTDAERALLAHLHAVPPDAVPDRAELTAVAGAAVIRRAWPDLDENGEHDHG